MHFLERNIIEAEKEGLSPRFIQMLKDQLAAAKTGKSAQQIYVAGIVNKPLSSDKS